MRLTSGDTGYLLVLFKVQLIITKTSKLQIHQNSTSMQTLSYKLIFLEQLLLKIPVQVCLCKYNQNYEMSYNFSLTLSWPGPLSHRNQSIYLQCKSMDCFLYDNGLRHERVNPQPLANMEDIFHVTSYLRSSR